MAKAADLLKRFLDRENATTRLNYEQALKDYADFARAPSPAVALERLIAGRSAAANEKVNAWKRAMIGTRNKSGKLIRGRGLSPATVNLRLTVLRGIVKSARTAGTIGWELDVAGVPAERVHDVRGPGLEVLKKLLAVAAADRSPAGVRNFAIMRIFAETGLRRRELARLDLGDVDMDGSAIWIQAKGRRQKERVAISPKCAEALREWYLVRPMCRSGALFTNLIPGRYGGISPTAVYDLVVALGKKAGIRKVRGKNKVHPHALRHTVFTEAAREVNRTGRGVETLVKFTRHKDARVAQTYLDATDDAASSVASALVMSLDR